MTVRILIDDLRSFSDHRECQTARTADSGIKALMAHREQTIDELWLDHDLGMLPDGSDHTIMPVIDYLAEAAYDGIPFRIERIIIHTSNPAGAVKMEATLRRWGYNTERHTTNHPEGTWMFVPPHLLTDDFA